MAESAIERLKTFDLRFRGWFATVDSCGIGMQTLVLRLRKDLKVDSPEVYITCAGCDIVPNRIIWRVEEFSYFSNGAASVLADLKSGVVISTVMFFMYDRKPDKDPDPFYKCHPGWAKHEGVPNVSQLDAWLREREESGV